MSAEFTMSKRLERHLLKWREIEATDCSPEALGKLMAAWMKKAIRMVPPNERPALGQWLSKFITEWAERDDEPPGFAE